MPARPPHLTAGSGARFAPFAPACLLAALYSSISLGAAPLLSADEFQAGKTRIEATLLADHIACETFTGQPRDVCRERARGKELVAQAQLELAHTGTRQSQDRLTTVRLGTTYDLARTRCNDQAGAAKRSCARDAQAARTRGQSALKAQQRWNQARAHAAEPGPDAIDAPPASPAEAGKR